LYYPVLFYQGDGNKAFKNTVRTIIGKIKRTDYALIAGKAADFAPYWGFNTIPAKLL
jgi:hypothetical protein